MKYLIIALTLLCCSCTPFEIKGIVVHKSFTKYHMCCDKTEGRDVCTPNEAAIIVPHVTTAPHVHHHSFVPSEWTITIANKSQHATIRYDSAAWQIIKVGQYIEVTVNP